MSKFKVGDRVKVVRMSGEPYYDDYVSIGATGEIVQFGEEKTSGRRVYVKFDGGQFTPCHDSSWYVDENMLELVPTRLESYVWYKSADHKLRADEIEDRWVIEQYSLAGKLYSVIRDFSQNSKADVVFGMYSVCPCVQYMLVDPPVQEEEPLEFDGVKPEVVESEDGFYVTWEDNDDKTFKSREEAIKDWNEWVKAHTK